MEKINYNYLIPLFLLLGSMVFLAPSLTGNVISEGVSEGTSSMFSIVLFFLGVLSFVFFKRKSN